MIRREVLDALGSEIEASASRLSLVIGEVRQSGPLLDLHLREGDEEIDESLEEASAWWGQGTQANVLAVHPEQRKITLRGIMGVPSAAGARVSFYLPKYLDRLLKLWEDPKRSAAALQLLSSLPSSQGVRNRTESVLFPQLRVKQREALGLRNQKVGFLLGPPGTGKTFTLGALIATILLEDHRARILLLSTTNRAVDEALLSVDQRLESVRLKSPSSEGLRKQIRRYGSHFEAARYEREKRQHLVSDTQRRAVISEIARMEGSVPDKTDIEAYAAWREKIDHLRRQIPKPDMRAPLLAMTTTAAAYAFEYLEAAPFDYVVLDEASQVSLPYAGMLGTLGTRIIFAGDPKQLAPIVKSQHPLSQDILRLSAFDRMNDTCCQLDEQSRMAEEICSLVGTLFYAGGLYVAEDSVGDRTWLAHRAVPKLDSMGRDRLHVEHCSTVGGFTSRNGSVGVSREESARLAVQIAKECSRLQRGSIAIITPFRKQRRDIEQLLRKEGLKEVRVSTVHSVQGGEFHTVIFDPVLGEPIRAGGTLLSDDREAPRLLNVALSRAQARFIILLPRSDRSNALLQRLADAIEMQASGDDEHVPLTECITSPLFPSSFVGKYVRHGSCAGKLLSSDRSDSFIILTKSGERRQFGIERTRSAIAAELARKFLAN